MSFCSSRIQSRMPHCIQLCTILCEERSSLLNSRIYTHTTTTSTRILRACHSCLLQSMSHHILWPGYSSFKAAFVTFFSGLRAYHRCLLRNTSNPISSPSHPDLPLSDPQATQPPARGMGTGMLPPPSICCCSLFLCISEHTPFLSVLQVLSLQCYIVNIASGLFLDLVPLYCHTCKGLEWPSPDLCAWQWQEPWAGSVMFMLSQGRRSLILD